MGAYLMAIELGIHFVLQAGFGIRHLRGHDEAFHDDSGNDDAEAENWKEIFKHISPFQFG